MSEFFDMGGYAAFVWPSYAVTAVVLVILVAASWLGLKSRRRTLETLQAAHGGRRARRRRETAAPDTRDIAPGEPVGDER